LGAHRPAEHWIQAIDIVSNACPRSLRGYEQTVKARKTTLILQLSAIALAALAQPLFTSCSQDFIGVSVKKPPPPAVQKNPKEVDIPRKNDPVRRVSGNGGGGGSSVFPGRQLETISLNVIQTSSESWWRNCLYAKTAYSNGWGFVSCNKDTTGNQTSVSLPAMAGVCNVISLKIETYKNVGSTCADRARHGLSCEGPYYDQPDSAASPQSDAFSISSGKTSAYSIYTVDNINNPDPMIISNSNWAVPDFRSLQGQMASWNGANTKNTWVRVFFEDQSAAAIAQARQSQSQQRALGVDYNDYVFDLKSEGISFTIENAGMENSALTCK
jgi:hypothetical protein